MSWKHLHLKFCIWSLFLNTTKFMYFTWLMCPNNKEIVFDSHILCLLGTVMVLSCSLLMSCLYVGAGLLAFLYMPVISSYCSEACIGRLVCAWLIVVTCFILVVLFLSISHNMQFWTKTLVHHCVCIVKCSHECLKDVHAINLLLLMKHWNILFGPHTCS